VSNGCKKNSGAKVPLSFHNLVAFLFYSFDTNKDDGFLLLFRPLRSLINLEAKDMVVVGEVDLNFATSWAIQSF